MGLQNKTKEILKENVLFLMFAGCLLFVFFGLPLPKTVEVDFYDFHVWECQQAHAQNMSYSLGSGFWYKPEEWHIAAPSIWHPSENPCTIPHGSNLGTSHTIIVFGLYGWFTSPWYG